MRNNSRACRSMTEYMLAGELIWVDPDPNPDNNYVVDSISFQDGSDTATITYNDGSSEAEVYFSELRVINPLKQTK